MEGWDGTETGQPTAATLRRWRRFGQSGAKLLWGGEAYAVSHGGRANPRQLSFDSQQDNEQALRRLRNEFMEGHRESGLAGGDLLLGLQLTHSGRFARPTGEPAPLAAVSRPQLDTALGLPTPRILTDDELERIAAQFVEVAGTAETAGFDFVDVKCCHGYLLHELLGAKTRPGKYGGTLSNRMLLLRSIIREIRRSFPRLLIGCRLSAGDELPRGVTEENGLAVSAGDDFPLEETEQLLAMLRQEGLRSSISRWVRRTIAHGCSGRRFPSERRRSADQRSFV